MTARIYDIEGACPTVRTCGGGNLEPKIVEPIVIDGYNRSIRAEKDTMGTLTRNCGGDVSTGNGYGIMEVQSQERFFAQAFETIKENDCDSGDTIDAYNKRINKSGVSPTLTTSPEGFKTAILPIESTPIQQNHIEVGKQIRVRKLTERECFRLMGVKDEDFEKIAYGKSYPTGYYEKLHNRTMKKCEWKILYLLERKRRQSKSSLYHLAGDSIVVNVLMEIFQKML